MQTQLSPKALICAGALMQWLGPRIRHGQRINIQGILRDVTNAHFPVGVLSSRIATACAGKLAADQNIDDRDELLSALEEIDEPEERDPTDVSDRPGEWTDGIDQAPDKDKLLTWLKQNLPDEKVQEFRQMFLPDDDDETDDDEPAGPREFEDMPRTGAMDSFYERYPTAQLISGDVPAPVRRKPASARVALDAAVQREDARESFEARFPDAARIG